MYNKNVVPLWCLKSKGSINHLKKQTAMNWNELLKRVKAKGYKFYKHGGKHDIYVHPDTGDTVTIERHWSQEVRPGLMKRILSQIGE